MKAVTVPSMQDVQTIEELGYQLGRVREQHGATLEHCARILHIRTKYLAALEAGKLEEIPGGVAYAKGYVQNYAGFLGFDRAEVAAAFERIHQAQNTSSRSFYLPEVLTKENKPSHALAIASLVAAVLFYGFWHVSQRPSPDLAAEEASTTRMLSVADIEKLSTPRTTLDASHPCAQEEALPFPPCYDQSGQAPAATTSLLLPPAMVSVLDLSRYLMESR